MSPRCLVASLFALLSFALQGCGPVGPSQLSPSERQERDLQQYRELTASLEANRSEVLGSQAMETAAVGGRLFWLEFPGFSPTLHSLEAATGAKVHYGFSIGSSAYNYRASRDVIATASAQGGAVIYRAYSAAAPNVLLGELTVPAPGGGQRWWAYAVDGTSLYFITQGAAAELKRWAVGAPNVETVLDLAQAGLQLGELSEFGVAGAELVLVESGRVWRLDLAARSATWLQNSQQVVSGGVFFDARGVLFTAANGPFYYRLGDGGLRDLKAEIAASGYRLNDTFATIHHYGADAVLDGDRVIYVGQRGLFEYGLELGSIRPLLLEPLDGARIDYRYPTVLEDGTLFVTGLLSLTGAAGAEGPVYRVDRP